MNDSLFPKIGMGAMLELMWKANVLELHCCLKSFAVVLKINVGSASCLQLIKSSYWQCFFHESLPKLLLFPTLQGLHWICNGNWLTHLRLLAFPSTVRSSCSNLFTQCNFSFCPAIIFLPAVIFLTARRQLVSAVDTRS